MGSITLSMSAPGGVKRRVTDAREDEHFSVSV
jgi:hypothetical protein